MGKVLGVAGGYLTGVIISLILSIIVVSILAAAQQTGGGFWLSIVPITYLIGAVATIWYSYGYSYDYGVRLGMDACKNEVEVG